MSPSSPSPHTSVTDLDMRNGFRLLHGHDEMPAPAALLAHGERWRPWRSVAAWYLWRAVTVPAGDKGRYSWGA